jgi:hypothetical protein
MAVLFDQQESQVRVRPCRNEWAGFDLHSGNEQGTRKREANEAVS